MTVRVVVAEDSLLVREGLVSLLQASADVAVVHACGDLPSLLAAAETFSPDVVLTDVRMPPSQTDEGVRAASYFRTACPDMGVVVVSQFVEPEYVLEVFNDGTGHRGYVVKDRISDLAYLVQAITTVAEGGSFIDDSAVQVLIRSRSQAVDSPLAPLSPREIEVLEQIATGRSNASVAESLHISVHSVEKHSRSIFTKLGLTENAELNRRVKAVLLFLADERVTP